MKNKILASFISLFFLSTFVYGTTLNELNEPKPISNRIGTGNNPEEYVTIKVKKVDEINSKTQNKDLSAYERTYGDLSIKRLALDVVDEFNDEKEEILADLSDMWVAVAGNSETMQYTIYKLSNPDENKPDENIIKRILKPVASMSTIAGATLSANPFMASGAMIGGNLLSAFTTDNKEINYRFTKVSDADMVILVRKIDDLQKRMMTLYMDYRTKKKVYEMAVKNVQKREEIYKSMQDKSREEIIIADVYLRNAQNFEAKARNEYFASRNILAQLVGEKTLEEIEARKKDLS